MIMKSSLDNYFATSDLACCAAIITIGFTLEAIDKTNPKASFLFLRSVELDKALEAYWRGELRVEPQSYFNQLRNIKARLYEQN